MIFRFSIFLDENLDFAQLELRCKTQFRLMHHSLLVLFTKLNDSAFDLLPAFDVVSFFTEKKKGQKIMKHKLVKKVTTL